MADVTIERVESGAAGAFVVRNSEEGDPEYLAQLTYRWVGEDMVVDHTEVESALRGQGVASALAAAAFAAARAEGFKICALCPYVQRWIEKHPEVEGELATRGPNDNDDDDEG